MEASVDLRCEIKPALIEFSEDGLSLKINGILIKENTDDLLDVDPYMIETKRKEHLLGKSQLMDKINDSESDFDEDFENDPNITYTV